MPILTRPSGDQITFRSSRTGTHVLDTYLEACELGGRTIPTLLTDLWSPDTGLLAGDRFAFRISPTTRSLEYRIGLFDDPDEGWLTAGNAYILRARGEYALNNLYEQLDLVTQGGSSYLCLTAHQATDDLPNDLWSVLIDGAALNAASSSAAASAASALVSANAASVALTTTVRRFIGASATQPTQASDGSALELGAYYFDTASGHLNVYTSTGWRRATLPYPGNVSTYVFTLASTTSTLTGDDDNDQTLTYDPATTSVAVTINGVRQAPSTYTATTGTSVVLASSHPAGTVILLDLSTPSTLEVAATSILVDTSVWVFNSANTTFALQTPATTPISLVSELGLLLVIDGVLQRPTIDYTLASPTSITLAAAPPSHTTAWAIAGLPLAEIDISGNAASVPFTPTGTIAATNVQDALAELDGDISALSATVTAHTATLATHASSIATNSSDIDLVQADLSTLATTKRDLAYFVGEIRYFTDDTVVGEAYLQPGLYRYTAPDTWEYVVVSTTGGAAGSASTKISRKTVTANYTLQAIDTDYTIQVDSPSPVTITIPANLNSDPTADFWCEIFQKGTGKATIVSALTAGSEPPIEPTTHTHEFYNGFASNPASLQISTPITIPAGLTNSALVIGLSVIKDVVATVGLSVATFAGQALTTLGVTPLALQGNSLVYLFSILAPPAGTGTLTITLTSSNSRILSRAVGALILTNVASLQAGSAVEAATNTANPLVSTLAGSVPDNALLLGMAGMLNGSVTNVAVANQTIRLTGNCNNTDGSASQRWQFITKSGLTAGSGKTLECFFSNNKNRSLVTAAALPAAGAAVTFLMPSGSVAETPGRYYGVAVLVQNNNTVTFRGLA